MSGIAILLWMSFATAATSIGALYHENENPIAHLIQHHELVEQFFELYGTNDHAAQTIKLTKDMLVGLLQSNITIPTMSHFRPESEFFEKHHNNHGVGNLKIPFVPDRSMQTAQNSNTDDEVWPAQCSQDFVVNYIYKSARDLFYVDLASNDYMRISNTFALDKYRGWKGVCIEANPKYWYNLVLKRSCQVFGAAVTSPHDAHTFVNFTFAPPGKNSDQGALGGLVGSNFDNKAGNSIAVPSMALAELLRVAGAPHDIDYLSLDIEGAEEYVLSKFDFSQYTFKVMTVERPSNSLRETLNRNGYNFLAKLADFHDELWIHSTMKDIIADADVSIALSRRAKKCGISRP